MVNWMAYGERDYDDLPGLIGEAKSGRGYLVMPENETGAAWGGALFFLDEHALGPPLALGVSRDEALDACERYETILCVPEARQFARDALMLRGWPPASGDDPVGGVWRKRMAELIEAAGRVDLANAGVGAAIEAEVALAAAGPGDLLTAEAFVARVRNETHRRLQMADLADGHTRQHATAQGFRA